MTYIHWCRGLICAACVAIGAACGGAQEQTAPPLFDPPGALSWEAAGAVTFELARPDVPPRVTQASYEWGSPPHGAAGAFTEHPAVPPARRGLWARIGSDYWNFYDRDTLNWLAFGVGVHAVVSNTNVDRWLRSEMQQNVRNAESDELSELFHNHKVFGEGTYLLPVYGAAALAAVPFEEDSVIGRGGEWGERSLRTIVVGAPPTLALQILIGASRPKEEHSESHWEPLKDDNGVSGHAFMGAIPFLSAAKMTDQPLMRGALYVTSAMPALSRVNDDAHYASQAILGWSIAYLASSAVDDTYQSPNAPLVLPGPVADGSGLNVMWRF